MRILFVCPYMPALDTSGGSGRMFRIIEGAAQRHDVSVLTFYETELELDHVPALEAAGARVEAIRRGQNPLAWKADPLQLVPPAMMLEFRNPTMVARVTEELSSGAYDLVQFEYTNLACLCVHRRPPVPSILTHHELPHRVMRQRRAYARGRVDRLRLRTDGLRALYFELMASRRFSLNVFLTDNEAGEIVRYLPGLEYAVSPMGVDCDFFAPTQTTLNPHEVVYVGNFRHRPNVDAAQYFAREVLPRVWAEQPEVTFTAVGALPPPELIRLAAEDPRIAVTGWVDDYRPIVARSAAYVVPVVSGGGMRGKVCEAWAMGKPVVSTPLGLEGFQALDGQNAMVAADAEEFAHKLVQVIRSPELQHQLGCMGYQLARRSFDWKTIAADHEQIYQRATKVHQGQR